MKIVFFGTPDYVIPVLENLHKAFKSASGESPIAAVVTQPPKLTGRKQFLEYSPVDTWAHKKKIPIFFDPKDVVEKNIKADVGILASYGAIIPSKVINHFPHGIINIHPSLLPKWRGASPVQATLISDDQEAGVTIIKIDELLDHGPIISQFNEEILPEDTTDTLRTRLFERSAEVLTTLLPAYLQGKITPREQDHSQATFTREIKKDDALIPPEFLDSSLQGRSLKAEWKIPFIKDFSIHPTPLTIHKFIRAMQPWPQAWTKIRIKNKELRIKILKARTEESQDARRKTQDEKKSYRVSRITHLVLDQVQLEGKNPVSWKQFKEAYATATFV